MATAPDLRIYVAGHRGLVGSALLRVLEAKGYRNLITRTHQQLDLKDHAATLAFFENARPQWVFLAAARVGGILANSTHPGAFIHDNLMIQTSVMEAARRTDVERLIFFGSTCTYPRECPQPMTEDFLLTGPMESTSEPYAVAKLAGMKQCQAYNAQYGTEFISVIPCTVYGPNDSFHLESGHVLSALIRKVHEAAVADQQEPVVLWGTGTPRREFLFADDLAEACLVLAGTAKERLDTIFGPNPLAINVGAGFDVSVIELAELVQRVVGYTGPVRFDTSRPDGAPRKLLESSRFRELGWAPRTGLEDGIYRAYQWFRERASEPAPVAAAH